MAVAGSRQVTIHMYLEFTIHVSTHESLINTIFSNFDDKIKIVEDLCKHLSKFGNAILP